MGIAHWAISAKALNQLEAKTIQEVQFQLSGKHTVNSSIILWKTDHEPARHIGVLHRVHCLKHTVCNFTQNIGLRCFVGSHILLQIYAV